MAKKVIFSDNTLWGVLNFRGHIIEHFVKKGYEVVIIAPREEKSEMQARQIPYGVRIKLVKMSRTKTNPFSDICYFFRILTIYRKECPNYVFHYTIKPNIYGSLAARLCGIPSSLMMAGLGYAFQNNNLVSKLARCLYRIGLKCSSNVFLLNEANRDELLKRKMCKASKITLLPGGEGVSLERFPYMENESPTVTFLFVGRLLFDKGYGEFVECARTIKKEFPNVCFEVIGTLDPSYPNSVSQERLEKDMRDQIVSYRGFVSDMKTVYSQKGLVMVLPSSYGEGLNRSLMEACATGKPIITTNIPGCRETVVEGVNGYCIAPHNTDQLINVVRRYIQLSTDEKTAMSLASRKLAEERFDISKVIEVYDNIV